MRLTGINIATVLALVHSIDAFAPSLFQQGQRTVPTQTEGVSLDLPDFDELFDRFKKVSPLARQAIDSAPGDKGGFTHIDGDADSSLRWKTIESKKNRLVHHIDKVDNFMDLGPPLIRFRATLDGPYPLEGRRLGEPFANFIMDLDQRKQWDRQVAQVDQIHSINIPEAAEWISQDKHGNCCKLGIGYCQTKAQFGLAPREQLTVCGVQNFDNGSTMIWGTELQEDFQEHLLPVLPGNRESRIPRAKSLLFCTTLTPIGENKFDVEYCLQMCTGGLPIFITTAVMIDAVKSLFRHAKKYYVGDELEPFLAQLDFSQDVPAPEAADPVKEVTKVLSAPLQLEAEEVEEAIEAAEESSSQAEAVPELPVVLAAVAEEPSGSDGVANLEIPEPADLVKIVTKKRDIFKKIVSKVSRKVTTAMSLLPSMMDRIAMEMATRDMIIHN